MRIVLITPYYIDSYPQHLSMGSAVKQAQNLSKEHQICVLTSGRSKSFEKVNKNLTIVSTNGWLIPDPINYVFCPQLLVRFISLASKFKPDVVMVSKFMFFSSFVIPIAKLMGIKVVTTTDTFPGINWFPRSRLVGAVMRLYARLIGLPLLWISDKVILLYKGLEPIAKKYHFNFVTIPNGVDDSYFEKQSLPKDIKKTKGEFWVGFVGRPESIKGYDLALKAADYFIKKDQTIKFVFIGGNTKPSVNGNKIFLGFRTDIKQIYQLLDCLILPSYAEGLPNVLLEAMAQGVPCIASNVGGVPSVIHNNENGYLINTKHTEILYQKIIKLKSNPILRTKLSESAKKSIHNNFNWTAIISQYKKILN